MANTLRLYARYLGISFRGQMQYPAAFVMASLGHFLITGLEFVAILALFDRFRSLDDWTLPQVALFYGVVNVAFSITDATARGFDTFHTMVKGGDFDRLLLRPRTAALQLAGQQLVLKRIGRLTQGLAVLLWGAWKLELVWTPGRVGLVLFAIAGGACMFYGLIVLQATLAFWTTESIEIANTVTYGGVETAQYPLTIYRPWFRRFFTFVVPLACVSYYPMCTVLGRVPAGVPAWLGWASPAVGVVFLLVALQVWRFGVRHYRSTGS